MNILSLFDGCSMAQEACRRAGIDVARYYASEIDKYAIKVTQKNFPNTIQFGDIRDIKAENLPKIDLIVGGSPCQGFSFAGKQLNFNDPRSQLFFEYVRLVNECKPKYFLLENVVMKKEFQDIISEQLGVQPIMINSSLVSAQNRKRLYWTNIPNVKQPENKGILLKDILETCENKVGRLVNRRINPETGKRDDYNFDIEPVQRLEPRSDFKSGTLTTIQKDNVVINEYIKISKKGVYKKFQDKASCLTGGGNSGGNHSDMDLIGQKLQHVGNATDIKGLESIKRIYAEYGKCPTLTTMNGGHRQPKVALNDYEYRRLTPLECERLQTLPDGFTEGVSNTQRYKMIGNGFTVDVIAHILKNIEI